MAGWDDTGGKGRREPTFGSPDDGLLSIRPEDRPTAGASTGRRRSARIEPDFAGRIVPEPASPPRVDAAAQQSLRETKMSRRRPPEDDFPDHDQEHPPRRERRRAERQPRARRRRTFFGHLTYWSLVACVWGLIGFVGFLGYNAMKLPPIDQLAVPKRPPNIAILAADGTLIANRGETGGSNVPIGELPKFTPKAFVAIEDRRFYDHWGIDPIGLMRAAMRNFSSGKVEQGGSTLTQQLAKNLFLTQERTLNRKAQEVILALWLERNYTKDQILELYLNRVYFGAGAYGIEAAAQKYYGKSARALTLGESVVLAGLMKSPSRLAPNRNPEGAAERAAVVLREMQDQGLVSSREARLAMASPGQARRQSGAGTANYAADWVMDVIDDYVGRIDTDIQVTTTFSVPMQAAAEQALVAVLDKNGDAKNVDQGALVAMTPDGAVRALVGGRNYAESQFNRAVLAKRQPGSAFKPFVYLAAIEAGLTPETLRDDSPVSIKGWSPENYTREYFGSVTLTRALSMSLNTVAVKLGQEVGIRNVARAAQRLGINSALSGNASLALGTSEVTPLELTTAYAAFANGGFSVTPHVIAKVTTVKGKVIYERKTPERARVIDPQHLAALNVMMRETLVSGTAKKAELPGWVTAGKTGTTQEHKDAWFVGYTGALVATVWLGNDDGDPMKKVSGSGLPVDVWSRFMRSALAGQPPRPLPTLAYLSRGEPPKPVAVPVSPAPQTVRPDSPAASTPSGEDALVRMQMPTRAPQAQPRPAVPVSEAPPPRPPGNVRSAAAAPASPAPRPPVRDRQAIVDTERLWPPPPGGPPETPEQRTLRDRQAIVDTQRLVPPRPVGPPQTPPQRTARAPSGPTDADRERLNALLSR